MTNLAISYINLADSATLTADPVAGASTPVTYLQNDARGYQFAAAAVGAQAIKGTWGGTAYTVGCVRLERTNLADGDTWRIQLFSGADWTTSVYDSGTVAPFATDLYDDWDFAAAEKIFTAVAGVKSFIITVTSAAVFQSSKLWVGNYTTAEYNPKMGMGLAWDTNSSSERMAGGTLLSNVQSKWRALIFDMLAATEAYRVIWQEIGRYASTDKSVWISVFPNLGGKQERDHSLIGKFEVSPATKWTGYLQYDYSMKVNEL